MSRSGPWQREFSGPLQALQNELNRLFDDYWAPGRFAGRPSTPTDLDPTTWVPPIDVVETPDSYVVTVEVPGVDPGTIDLSVTGNVLTLRGNKPVTENEPPALLQERRFGPFHREIPLNGAFDFESAQAEARLGVLVIRLPKREAARPRTIPVQSR
ncbi:MAG: Hsp20/alpha crystallin family protein [Isosphaeraceae bacterium]